MRLLKIKNKAYQDVVADLPELWLNFFSVFFGHLLFPLRSLRLLLDWRNDPPGRPKTKMKTFISNANFNYKLHFKNESE